MTDNGYVRRERCANLLKDTWVFSVTKGRRSLCTSETEYPSYCTPTAWGDVSPEEVYDRLEWELER